MESPPCVCLVQPLSQLLSSTNSSRFWEDNWPFNSRVGATWLLRVVQIPSGRASKFNRNKVPLCIPFSTNFFPLLFKYLQRCLIDERDDQILLFKKHFFLFQISSYDPYRANELNLKVLRLTEHDRYRWFHDEVAKRKGLEKQHLCFKYQNNIRRYRVQVHYLRRKNLLR